MHKKYLLDLFAANLLESSTKSIGLLDGKIGHAIFLHWYHKYLSNKKQSTSIKQIAYSNQLVIESIEELISSYTRYNIVSWCEVGLGILYLYSNGFLYYTSKIDTVLRPIDDYVFKYFNTLNYSNFSTRQSLLPLLYIIKRYPRYKEKEKDLYKLILLDFTNNIDNVLKNILDSRTSLYDISKDTIPIILYLIGEIYQFDIFNFKISKDLKIWYNEIFSFMPVNQFSKIYYIWGIGHMIDIISDIDVQGYYKCLYNTLNIELFKKELLYSTPFFIRGVSSVYYFLKSVVKNNSELAEFLIEIESYYLNFIKIDDALQRNNYFKESNGLINGYGIVLMLLNKI